MNDYFASKLRPAGFFAAVLFALTAVPMEAFAGLDGYAPLSLTTPTSTNRTTFNFSALCFDCNSGNVAPGVDSGNRTPVTGTLVLHDYSLGDNFDHTKFVSFAYDALGVHVPDFNIKAGTDPIFSVLGNLSGDGATSDVFTFEWLSGNHNFDLTEYETKNIFSLNGINRTWSISSETGANDFGDSASFTTVPEPGTLALLGLAGVALGWHQRRRRAKQVAH